MSLEKKYTYAPLAGEGILLTDVFEVGDCHCQKQEVLNELTRG